MIPYLSSEFVNISFLLLPCILEVGSNSGYMNTVLSAIISTADKGMVRCLCSLAALVGSVEEINWKKLDFILTQLQTIC